jgi:outer membrane immunogenic protein
MIPRQPAPPAFSWTGLYIGANAGYGWGTNNIVVPTIENSGRLDGHLGGLQIGYNYQVGNIVLGIEADGQFTGARASSYLEDNAGNELYYKNDKLPWFATVRGRAGYALDSWLFYVTGGGAFGEFKSEVRIAGVGEETWKQTRAGWTAGLGVENAFSSHWSWKFEYLYLDLGKASATVLGLPATADVRFNVVRGGINYRF